jgi:PadR family transcriptional regulator, regulatory protein PadR
MPDARRLGYATVAILKAIRDGSPYGLDIMEATGLPSGTVYPTLGRMEARGFLTAHWEDRRVAEREGRPRRRYYKLTGDGRVALDAAIRAFDALAGDAAPARTPR